MNHKLSNSLIFLFMPVITLLLFCTGYFYFHGKGKGMQMEFPIPQQVKIEMKGSAKQTPPSTAINKSNFDMKDVIIPEQISEEELLLIGNSEEEKLILKQVQKFWIGRIKENFEPVFRVLHKYIREGDTVADIGCGAGWYTYYLSQNAGDKGRVYAVDTNPVAYLSQGVLRREMAKKYGEDKFRNIIPILNDRDHLYLGENFVDVAYLSDVHILHVNMGEVVTGPDGKTRNIELEKIEKYGYEKQQKELLKLIDKDQKKFITNIHKTLKNGGIFIVAEDMKPPLDKTKLQKKYVIELMKMNNFDLLEDACYTEYHLLVFVKK